MFFLMTYQTVVATRREINLARQFCRVSLVHRMETNVARQPFEVIRLLPAFISSLLVSISARIALANAPQTNPSIILQCVTIVLCRILTKSDSLIFSICRVSSAT